MRIKLMSVPVLDQQKSIGLLYRHFGICQKGGYALGWWQQMVDRGFQI